LRSAKSCARTPRSNACSAAETWKRSHPSTCEKCPPS
jgi:hypothetical protein